MEQDVFDDQLKDFKKWQINYKLDVEYYIPTFVLWMIACVVIYGTMFLPFIELMKGVG